MTITSWHMQLSPLVEMLHLYPESAVPTVAIPIGYDQPGVAARIAYHGVGEFLKLEELTVARLSELVQRVRRKQSYHDKARQLQKVIAQTRGLDLAAEVIERAFGISPTADAEGAELLHA